MNEACSQAPTPDWPCLACKKGFEEHESGVVVPSIDDPSGRGKAAYHLRCFTESLGIKTSESSKTS